MGDGDDARFGAAAGEVLKAGEGGDAAAVVEALHDIATAADWTELQAAFKAAHPDAAGGDLPAFIAKHLDDEGLAKVKEALGGRSIAFECGAEAEAEPVGEAPEADEAVAAAAAPAGDETSPAPTDPAPDAPAEEPQDPPQDGEAEGGAGAGVDADAPPPQAESPENGGEGAGAGEDTPPPAAGSPDGGGGGAADDGAAAAPEAEAAAPPPQDELPKEEAPAEDAQAATGDPPEGTGADGGDAATAAETAPKDEAGEAAAASADAEGAGAAADGGGAEEETRKEEAKEEEGKEEEEKEKDKEEAKEEKEEKKEEKEEEVPSAEAPPAAGDAAEPAPAGESDSAPAADSSAPGEESGINADDEQPVQQAGASQPAPADRPRRNTAELQEQMQALSQKVAALSSQLDETRENRSHRRLQRKSSGVINSEADKEQKRAVKEKARLYEQMVTAHKEELEAMDDKIDGMNAELQELKKKTKDAWVTVEKLGYLERQNAVIHDVLAAEEEREAMVARHADQEKEHALTPDEERIMRGIEAARLQAQNKPPTSPGEESHLSRARTKLTAMRAFEHELRAIDRRLCEERAASRMIAVKQKHMQRSGGSPQALDDDINRTTETVDDLSVRRRRIEEQIADNELTTQERNAYDSCKTRDPQPQSRLLPPVQTRPASQARSKVSDRLMSPPRRRELPEVERGPRLGWQVQKDLNRRLYEAEITQRDRKREVADAQMDAALQARNPKKVLAQDEIDSMLSRVFYESAQSSRETMKRLTQKWGTQRKNKQLSQAEVKTANDRMFYERKDKAKQTRANLRKKYIEDTEPQFQKLTKEALGTSIARLITPPDR